VLIWVKAIAVGFDGMQLRKPLEGKRPADVFQIEETQFSKKWMRKCKAPVVLDEHGDQVDEEDEEAEPTPSVAGQATASKPAPTVSSKTKGKPTPAKKPTQTGKPDAARASETAVI
jgi:hypothetical protein